MFVAKLESTIFQHPSSFEPPNAYFEDYFSVVVAIAVFYIFSVFALKKIMATRDPLNLQWGMFLWSSLIAIFSILGSYRLVSAVFLSFQQKGAYATFYDQDKVMYRGPTGLWLMMFVLSKVVELGDTVFIVLRKKRLIFLQWYHHASAMVMAWYIYGKTGPTMAFVATMNLTIHSLMYIYFALSASKWIKIPNIFPLCLTTIQMTQFVVAMAIHINAIGVYLVDGQRSPVPLFQSVIITITYITYFVLFANFFVGRYLTPSKKQVEAATVEENGLRKQKYQ